MNLPAFRVPSRPGLCPLRYPQDRHNRLVSSPQAHPYLPSPAAPASREVPGGQTHRPRGEPAQSTAPESRYWLRLPRQDQREYWGHLLGTWGWEPGDLVLTSRLCLQVLSREKTQEPLDTLEAWCPRSKCPHLPDE